MTAFAADAWSVMLELAPWLLLGAVLAGVLHVVVPHSFVEQQLRGRLGVAKAVVLGVPLPLCSCGVIPTALGLKRDGAGDGPTTGFLIATPQTGVDSVLVSAGFLGWPFAITKVVAALATGLVGGLLVDRSAPSETTQAATQPTTERRTIRDGVEHSADMLRSIWVWIVFGVLASAALTSFVEPGTFTSLTAQGTLIGFAAVLLISLPLYVCATASVPIAVGLIAAGLPTGAALVFLMAGPATNVATLGAVRATLGLRATMIYLTTIVVGSTAFGLAYESAFGAFDVDMLHAHDHDSLWRTISAIALLAVMAGFAYERLRGSSMWPQPASAETATVVEVGVAGMTCNNCVGKLDRAVRSAPGADRVEVTLEPGSVRVHGSLTSDDVRREVVAAGFTPVD